MEILTESGEEGDSLVELSLEFGTEGYLNQGPGTEESGTAESGEMESGNVGCG